MPTFNLGQDSQIRPATTWIQQRRPALGGGVLNTTVTPTPAALTTAGSTPVEATTTTPSALAAALTGSTPVEATTTTPSALAATLSGATPLVGNIVAPAALALVTAGSTPVEATTTTPSALAAALTGSTPAAGQGVRPSALAATLAGSNATVGGGVVPTPAAAALTGSTPVEATTTTPSAGSLSLTGSNATVGGGVRPTAGTLTITGATAVLGAGVVPTAGVAGLYGQYPYLMTTVSPSSNAAVVSFSTPRLGLGVVPTPAALVIGATTPTVSRTYQQRGLRIDVYTAGGIKLGFGPIRPLGGSGYKVHIDEVGAFQIDVPIWEERASYVTQRCQLWFYSGDEGLVFRGIVLNKKKAIGSDGTKVLRISGASMAQQLADTSVNLGLGFSGSTLSAVVGSTATSGSLLYSNGGAYQTAGWSAGALDSPAWTLNMRADGSSVWAAAVAAAKQFHVHVREDSITLSGGSPVKVLDMGAFGTSNGLVFKNVDAISPRLAENTRLFPISEFEAEEDSTDVVNSVLIVGGGEGVNQLTLRYATRSVAGGFAYDVTSFTGPDGRTQYCIEDATSIAAYGRIRRTFSVKDAVPQAQSSAGVIAAANALYDLGVQILQRRKDPPTVCSFQAVGLRHVSAGVQVIKPGDKSRLLYRAVTRDPDGTDRAYIDVDASVWIMGWTRTWDATGYDTWTLETSTVDRVLLDDAETVAQAIADIEAMKVSLRPYTFRNSYVLTPQSINGSTTATLNVPLDANITYLHKARLRWRYRALRSNVTTTANGGSSTPSSSSGGGTTVTSAGGSGHTHTISGTAASTDGAHRHQMFNFVGTGSSGSPTGSPSNTSAPSVASTQQQDAGHTHTETGTTTGTNIGNHSHSMAGHTHVSPVALTYTTYTTKTSGGADQTFSMLTIGALTQQMYTYESGGSHTHTISGSAASTETAHAHNVTISAHTHTVTIAAHNHALTYGIYDDTTPTGITGTLTINGTDRTAALQGASNPAAPWSTSGTWYISDISAYLQSGSTEFPLQQTNTLTFGAAVLCDVEAVLDIDMTRTALLPV